MGRGSQRLVTRGFLNHQGRKRPQPAPPRPTKVGTPAAPSSVLRLFRAMSSEDGSAMNEGHRPRLRIAAGVPTSVGRGGALIAPVGPSNASKAAYEHGLEALPDQASRPLLPLLPLMALTYSPALSDGEGGRQMRSVRRWWKCRRGADSCREPCNQGSGHAAIWRWV